MLKIQAVRDYGRLTYGTSYLVSQVYLPYVKSTLAGSSERPFDHLRQLHQISIAYLNNSRHKLRLGDKPVNSNTK